MSSQIRQPSLERLVIRLWWGYRVDSTWRWNPHTGATITGIKTSCICMFHCSKIVYCRSSWRCFRCSKRSGFLQIRLFCVKRRNMNGSSWLLRGMWGSSVWTTHSGGWSIIRNRCSLICSCTRFMIRVPALGQCLIPSIEAIWESWLQAAGSARRVVYFAVRFHKSTPP